VVWFLIYGIGSLPQRVNEQCDPPQTFLVLPEVELIPGLKKVETKLINGESGVKCGS